MPIITLEVMSDSSNPDPNINYEASYASEIPADEFTRDNTGVHFLSEKMSEDQQIDEKEEAKETPKVRNDLLEYMLRDDGSVICKLCGEILQSRTHWYRHKYKLHVAQTSNPTPLFQCEQCLVYFKSRKGYIGHLASRHSDLLADSSPILTNSQAEAYSKEKANSQTQTILEATDEADPEQAIPKTSVPNYQTTVVKQAPKSTEQKKVYKVYRAKAPEVRPPDYDEKRSREEKLVADIIDRVRRECEAQGGTSTSTRRGYSRRTTAMYT